MNGDVLGGGVVVALAAGLWLIYLVPTMFRRREYLATERNAVRLQQTLRILAETAEAPQAVRLEANARTVAAQEKVLRRAEQQAEQEARVDAEHQAEAEKHARAEARLEWARREEALKARVKTEELDRLKRASAAAAVAAVHAPVSMDAVRTTLRKIRRGRAVTSLALLLALVAIVVGAVVFVVGGSWVILAAGLVAFAAGILVLGRLAGAARRVRRARPAIARAPRTASVLYDDADHDAPQAIDVDAVPVAANWTPQPLPKPLHLSPGTVAAAAMASVEAASELRRAEARAELERRTAELVAGVVQLRPRPVVPAVPAVAEVPEAAEEKRPASRFDAMGLVDGDTDTGALDISAAFRRRAAV